MHESKVEGPVSNKLKQLAWIFSTCDSWKEQEEEGMVLELEKEIREWIQ